MKIVEKEENNTVSKEKQSSDIIKNACESELNKVNEVKTNINDKVNESKKDINDQENEEKTEINIKENALIKNEKSKTTVRKILNKSIQIFLTSRLFVVVIGLLLVLKTVFLYKTAIFVNKPIEKEYIEMIIGFVFIFLTLPMLLKGKIRIWIALIIDLLTSVLLFINELYYSYSSNLVSVSQISNLQYGKEISAALPNLLHVWQILYFVDIIILLVFYIINRKKVLKISKWFYIPGIIYAIVAMIFAVQINKNWIMKAEEFQYNKLQQIQTSSIFGYHYLDLKNNFNMKKNVKYKTKTEMLQAYNELKTQYDEKYNLVYDFKDIAKDKNVIVVQLESVQKFVVNRKINGKEITPNLNKFLNENIEFTNMHNQSYTTTADSEHTAMNSLYPLENGMSFAQYSSNDYNDIFHNFKKDDYITTYIHGNVGSFWNREAVYSKLPIDHLYFDNIFDENTERINEYIADEHVYRKMVEEMKNYDGKFFLNIVAASSHTAFDLSGIENKDQKVNIDVGDEYRGIYFGNYLEAVNYADYAFGIFIDELKKAGLYDDTVILVYGDHAGLQMYNYEMMDFIREVNPSLNDIQTQINYTNVACGIKIPGVEPMKINKPTSRLDVKPTLMEICGIEDEFSLGTSMFADKDFVCINNGKIITDKYFYDGKWYLIASGEEVNLDNISEEEKEKLDFYSDCLQKELDISLSVNLLNLLKK